MASILPPLPEKVRDRARKLLWKFILIVAIFDIQPLVLAAVQVEAAPFAF